MSGSRPITDTLRHIGRGVFLDRVSDAAAEIVRSIDESGGTGELTLKLKFKKANRGGAIVVAGEFATKLPKAPADDALLFATPEGNLVASDPKQVQLDLRSVPKDDASPLKQVTAT